MSANSHFETDDTHKHGRTRTGSTCTGDSKTRRQIPNTARHRTQECHCSGFARLTRCHTDSDVVSASMNTNQSLSQYCDRGLKASERQGNAHDCPSRRRRRREGGEKAGDLHRVKELLHHSELVLRVRARDTPSKNSRRFRFQLLSFVARRAS